MKDAGLPLLPHGVGGGAEEGPVVHGVLGGVAQAALSTLALGSLVGDPEHCTVSGQHQRGTHLSLSHTQPFASAFPSSQV